LKIDFAFIPFTASFETAIIRMELEENDC